MPPERSLTPSKRSQGIEIKTKMIGEKIEKIENRAKKILEDKQKKIVER